MKHHAAIIAVGLLFLIPEAHAQPARAENIHDRIQQLRKVRMIEMLDLTEEQSVRFFARLHEFEKETESLQNEKEAGLDKIERLVRNRADSAEFTEVFPQILAVNQTIVDHEKKFVDGLREILTVEQRGKYFLFDRQFERELRESLNEIQRRRRSSNE